jgi:two-component system chemotaxis sensor kinase CheA
MVQIGDTFNRFHRVVRDVSKELGKDIELVISGAETELDKTVVEKIGDPLMHLVRNAMDHGIESADVRIAAASRRSGRSSSTPTTTRAASSSRSRRRRRPQPETIRPRPSSASLIQPRPNLRQRDHQPHLRSRFLDRGPGLQLSGRGVGMDVVRRNITALRGTVDRRKPKPAWARPSPSACR